MKSLVFSLAIFGMLQTSVSFAQSTTIMLSADEAQFYQILNRFRAFLQLPTLSLDQRLETASRNHSIWMDTYLQLNHNEGQLSPFDRMTADGYPKNAAEGENIACGNGDALATFKQWAYSPGHLLNMINPHYHVEGIARAGTGNERCPYYWTNDFASTLDESQDPVGTTDLNTIANAIIAVSGPIPNNVTVSLTEPTEPVPAPVPAPVAPRPASPSVALSSAPTVSSSANTGVTELKCEVPYALGKGITTRFVDNDTTIDATRSSDGSYDMTLSYTQGGQDSSAYPISITGVSMTKSVFYPLVTLISPPGTLIGGFTLQVNLKTGMGQFDSIGSAQAVSGQVSCQLN